MSKSPENGKLPARPLAADLNKAPTVEFSSCSPQVLFGEHSLFQWGYPSNKGRMMVWKQAGILNRLNLI